MLIYWRVNSASLPLFALPHRRSLRFTTPSLTGEEFGLSQALPQKPGDGGVSFRILMPFPSSP